MNCTKCGKTMILGEMCPCQQIDIFRRQQELEEEKSILKEEDIIETDRDVSRKKEKIKKIYEKKENIFNNIYNFLSDMFLILKDPDNISDNYIKKEIKSYAITITILNIITNILMIYVLLSKSVLHLLLNYFSVFEQKSTNMIFLLSVCIYIIPTILLKINKTLLTRKNTIYLDTAEYIYLIPIALITIIITSISPFLGLIGLACFLSLKIICIYEILKPHLTTKRLFLNITILNIIFVLIIYFLFKTMI